MDKGALFVTAEIPIICQNEVVVGYSLAQRRTASFDGMFRSPFPGLVESQGGKRPGSPKG